MKFYTGPITVFVVGAALIVGAVFWQTRISDAQTPVAAGPPPDQTQAPSKSNGGSVTSPKSPSTPAPTYQQNNQYSNGVNLQGDVSLRIPYGVDSGAGARE